MISLTYPVAKDYIVVENIKEARKKLSKIGIELAEESNLISDVDEVQMRTIIFREPEILKLPGYKYLGTKKYEDGIPAIFAIEGCENLFLQNDERCDHCNISRHRTTYHYFKNDDGKTVCIGSACAEQMFGIDLNKILFKYWGIVLGLIEHSGFGSECEEESERGPKNRSSVLLFDLINLTMYSIENYGWKSKSDDDSTVENIKGLLYSTERKNELEMSLKYKADFGGITEKLIKRFSSEPTNNFEFNIFSALFDVDDNGPRLKTNIIEKSFGLVCYAIHEVTKIVLSLSQRHLGVIGEKISFKGTIAKITPYETQWGWSKSIVFVTDNKEQINWFTGADGDTWIVGETYDCSATVKDHVFRKIGDSANHITKVTRVVQNPFYKIEKVPFKDKEIYHWFKTEYVDIARKIGLTAKFKTFGTKKYSLEVYKGGHIGYINVLVNKEIKDVLENTRIQVI